MRDVPKGLGIMVRRVTIDFYLDISFCVRYVLSFSLT